MGAEQNRLHFSYASKRHSAWPEKVAPGAGAFVTIALFLSWAVLAGLVKFVRDTRIDMALFWWFVERKIALALKLWLTLRAVCFATGNWPRCHSRS